MEDQELARRLDEMMAKLDAVYASSEKTRKLFVAMIVIAIIAFVLPLIGLLFAVPAFLSTYDSIANIGM
ncbi:hypothetical protein FJY93_00950 [Candidatus Kaiserbacteria bacterium]|nr:hypothetical protein [Candidatus Kaiserbacteria bacterium]